MNKILAFDVSNNICTVAVTMGDELLSYGEDLRPSKQAEMLIPMIEDVLKSANMVYNDLDYIVSTIGPGSFTGIKIGLSTARAIVRVTGAKAIGISNFDISFFRLRQQVSYYENAAIILNAYRNQFYLQTFNKDQVCSEPKLIDTVTIIDELKEFSKNLVIAGNGINIAYNELIKIPDIIILPRFPNVKAIHLARCANQKIIENSYSGLDPMYVRPPDAIPPSDLK